MNQYQIELEEDQVLSVKVHDMFDYVDVTEHGARQLISYEGFVFVDATDVSNDKHYLITYSSGNVDLGYFLELNLESFYELLALTLLQDTKQLVQERLYKLLVNTMTRMLCERLGRRS